MWACKNESSCSLGDSSHLQCLEHSGTSELPLVATSKSLLLTCLPLEEHCVMNYLPQKRKRKRKKKTLHRGPENTDVFSPLKLKCELFLVSGYFTGSGDSLCLWENIVEREFGIILGLYANGQKSLLNYLNYTSVEKMKEKTSPDRCHNKIIHILPASRNDVWRHDLAQIKPFHHHLLD